MLSPHSIDSWWLRHFSKLQDTEGDPEIRTVCLEPILILTNAGVRIS